MTEQGIVVRYFPDKGFGFIQREGKEDIFFHKADYPKGVAPREGDRLEFDGVPGKEGQKPRARNIKVLERGAEEPKTKITSQPKSKELEVGWSFTYSEKSDSLLVFPVLTRGGQPVKETHVRLRANRKQIKEPAPVASTDKHGECYFRVPLKAGEKSCDLVAQVDDQSFSKLWELGQDFESAQSHGSKGLKSDTVDQDDKDRLQIHIDNPDAKGKILVIIEDTKKTGPGKTVKIRVTSRVDFSGEMISPETKNIPKGISFEQQISVGSRLVFLIDIGRAIESIFTVELLETGETKRELVYKGLPKKTGRK